MINKLLKISSIIVAFVLIFSFSFSAISNAEPFETKSLEPQLSSDEKTLYNGIPTVAYMIDPNPPENQVNIPPPVNLRTSPEMLIALPEQATATFSITYVANGDTDVWGRPCTTFPEEAKTAFNAAAAIWANILQSTVPITIKACWSSELGAGVLGSSGGGNLYKDFAGAPRANTWYSSSLANAFYGSDLNPSNFDMHITYTSDNVTWYYGTDGVTPAGQYDLMSVVLHEIAHGLNFSGSMSYSSGTGSYGYSTVYPNIYDTFMRDGTANPGSLLTDTGVYTNPSTALGSALISNSIWFHGANAMAANGGQRVKMYAPTTWAGGSSYSHLDYSTFAGTANRLMVYAISSGVSTHDPGPIALGMFKDMGWTTGKVKNDFNADGKSDLLWRNTSTGENIVWYMDGITVTGMANISSVPLTWEVAGTADLNSDTYPDIFWRNTSTGENIVWYMNGIAVTGMANISSVPLTWEVASTADFNSDTYPDIIWRNTSTGENIVWYMNGITVTGMANISSVPTTWEVAGTADFNSDTYPDIIWRNTSTGENIVWYMNGITVTGMANISSVPLTWEVAGTADFNADTKPDIFWRNTSTGENIVWYMDGITVTGMANISSVPTDWEVAGN